MYFALIGKVQSAPIIRFRNLPSILYIKMKPMNTKDNQTIVSAPLQQQLFTIESAILNASYIFPLQDW